MAVLISSVAVIMIIPDYSYLLLPFRRQWYGAIEVVIQIGFGR
jgi:hypothetical protein